MPRTTAPSSARTTQRPRLYYGWTMLGIATVATMATSPGQTYLVSQFYTSFQTELGLEKTTPLARAYMFGTLGAGLLMPLVGFLSDRFGTRIMMGLAAALLAFTCALIGYAENLTQLTLAFFCLRTFGQGALGLVAGHTIAMWYEKRLGIAESVRHTGMSIASVVLPPLTIWMIATLGWKSAYAILGLVIYLAVIPPVVLLFRGRPEDIGQHLDNIPPDHGEHPALEDIEPDAAVEISRATSPTDQRPDPLEAEPYFTSKEAIRTDAYWIVTGALVANATIFTAIALEHQIIVRDAGHSPEVAASLIPISGIVAMLAVPVSGWLVDKFPERILLACTTVLLGLSCACAAMAQLLPLLYSAMVLMGMTQSLIFVLASPIFARYFGRRHHGAIRGTLARSMILGTAVGPYLLSLGASLFDGYTVPLLLCWLLTIPLTIAALSMKRPEPPHRPV